MLLTIDLPAAWFAHGPAFPADADARPECRRTNGPVGIGPENKR
jgi:hypothetical protein